MTSRERHFLIVPLNFHKTSGNVPEWRPIRYWMFGVDTLRRYEVLANIRGVDIIGTPAGGGIIHFVFF